MYDTVIRGGALVTPAWSAVGDVGIAGERIAALGVGLAGDRVIDAQGCYVIPGGVDAHVHLQMRLGELTSADDFHAGTRAAIAGGTTTVVDFTDPQPDESLLEALARRRAEADGRVFADYGLHMTLPAWHVARKEQLAQAARVVELGCATFKLYMAYPHVRLDDVQLLAALRAVANAGGRAVIHAETGPVLDALRADAVAGGRTAALEHASTRPAALEASAVERAAVLAELAGCPLLVFHVGAGAVVEALRRRQGARPREAGRLWAETCPQYLLLTAAEHLGREDGHLYICAPPLREPGDQEAIWDALASGVIQTVGTDHCPWTLEEKTKPDFTGVPGGVPGIEARLALVHHFGVNAGRLSLARWVQACCGNPAAWMGLGGKGQLAPGYDADIVIFDPQASVTIDADRLRETAGWTPYAGITVQGWARDVFLRGRLVCREGVMQAEPSGRFVARRYADSGLRRSTAH